MEKEVAERLEKICQYRHKDLFRESPLDEKYLNEAIKDFENKNTLSLGDEQKEAIRVCLKNTMSIVSGGAGVGKTSLLRCIYHIIKIQGGNIVQMALAGRAARRMKEATNHPAITIARFITSNCTNELDHNSTVVIDEASMLDLPSAFKILRKIPEGCRLILVGDSEQLPPIGPGLIFHLLARDLKGLVPTVELTKVYRQEEKTGIPLVSQAVRDRKWPDLPAYSGLKPGVSIIPATTGEVSEVLKRVYADLGGNSLESDVQVLSITNDETPFGVLGANANLSYAYSQGRKRVYSYSSDVDKWGLSGSFAEGDPVMFKENDWDRDLFNGTLGKVIKAYDPPTERFCDPSLHVCARVRFDTGEQTITVADLNRMTLAYSITTHKSQGSQFRRVIVLIKNSRHLDKSLIYTAITRGAEQVVLIGDIEAAKRAVENGSSADKREVGLGHLLKQIIKPDPKSTHGQRFIKAVNSN
jgi:exodeoxyribonuclease V alpha subunit